MTATTSRVPPPLKLLDNPERSSLAPLKSLKGPQAISAVRRADYNKAISGLEQFHFWQAARGGKRPLWQHQKEAVATGVAFLNADIRLESEGGVAEAALAKMPTGSGKSGVIAVLSRCLPKIRKVLVLAPRAALADQLLADIRWRFWDHLGYETAKKGIWTAAENEMGAVLESAYAHELLPSEIRGIMEFLDDSENKRAVLVGTLQAMDQIRRELDDVDRRAKAGKSIPPGDEDRANLYRRFIETVKTTFDLVVVDEGHYEPAPSWSRTVRRFDRPTILFSATPFRNDYKSFRVRGRFVYNLPIEDVEKAKIIRTVEFASATPNKCAPRSRTLDRKVVAQVSDEDDSSGAADLTEDEIDRCNAFVAMVAKLATPLMAAQESIPEPKIIVRAASFEALCLIQSGIGTGLQHETVLIHDRVKKDDIRCRRFHTVAAAKKNASSARIWLHESKLLEGIDDPSFVAVAILDPFQNARQLIQQIGRAIRSSDPKRKTTQMATIIAFPEYLKKIEASWVRYRKFEDYCKKNVARVVQSEAAMPDRVMEIMPDLQYVGGEFRDKYLLNQEVQARDIQLPLRVSIFEIDKDLFDIKDANEEVEEAILAEDRFVPRPILGLDENTFGFCYYSWRVSPYLVEQYLSEWSLNVFLATQIDGRFYCIDTGGIVFEPADLEIRRADRSSLLKAFPHDSAGKAGSTLTRMASISLDMSDRAIRSQAIRTRSFETTFTDLLDPSLVPTSAYGFVGGKGRYLGVATSRVSDFSEKYVAISEYLDWVRGLHKEITDPKRQANKVFDRYAELVCVDTEVAERPDCILLDLTSETFQEFGVNGAAEAGRGVEYDMPYDDLCADIYYTKDNENKGMFDLKKSDGSTISCSIEYRLPQKRYRITSDALDEAHKPLSKNPSSRIKTITQLINRAQAFRILVPREGVVYSQGSFYRTRDVVLADGTVAPLANAEAIPALAETISEKGEHFQSEPRWLEQSIFGMFKAMCDASSPGDDPRWGELGREIGRLDVLLLDDGGTEIGDFIGLDRFSKRVIVMHAKASNDLHVDAVTHLQAVGRQAVASLAFCSTQARVDGLKNGRWKRTATANTVELAVGRLFKMHAARDYDNEDEKYDAIEQEVLQAMTNPRWSKEVWIVAGRLLEVEKVREKASRKQLSNRMRQVLMFLASLQTACGRANATLRIFGH